MWVVMGNFGVLGVLVLIGVVYFFRSDFGYFWFWWYLLFFRCDCKDLLGF